MAYKTPTFNLTANYWHAGGPPYPPPGQPLGTPCQLRMYRTAFMMTANTLGSPSTIAVLVPKGTDVRSAKISGGAADTFEIPAGSRRFYAVLAVDDVAKGFLNEYRMVCLVAVSLPFPLP